MGLVTLEHSKLAYRADLVAYGVALPALLTLMIVAAPGTPWPWLLGFGLAGLVSWSLAEYLLHRFLLHGLMPFSGWHMRHHRRPVALIGTPTLMSAALIFVLAFLPALLWADLGSACALTFGVTAGYFAYTITHHAVHHWRMNNAWVKRRKRWHALHHGQVGKPCHFGVTSAFWDHVFGTDRRSC